MNKRLRKKKHKGEFNYKGFEVTCTFEPKLFDSDAVDRFLDEYIEFVESLELGTGGGIDEKQMGQHLCVMKGGRRQRNGQVRFGYGHATEEHRGKLYAWLSSKLFVTNLVIGPLQGSWW